MLAVSAFFKTEIHVNTAPVPSRTLRALGRTRRDSERDATGCNRYPNLKTRENVREAGVAVHNREGCGNLTPYPLADQNTVAKLATAAGPPVERLRETVARDLAIRNEFGPTLLFIFATSETVERTAAPACPRAGRFTPLT